MINVNAIDIKCRTTAAKCGDRKSRRKNSTRLDKTRLASTRSEDAIIDGLFTVSTVRYDTEIWAQGGQSLSLCLGNVYVQ